MTLYPAGINPAVSLYNLWHSLLSAQEVLDANTVNNPTYKGWHTWTHQPYPRISYGSQHTGIGVHSFDGQQRPVIEYGGWFNQARGIYPYLLVDADGNFRLVHPHGYNHDRLGRHTFLDWSSYGGQYIWYVSPSHAPGQNVDPADFRTRVPYNRERVLKGNSIPWTDRKQSWNYLLDLGGGRWSIQPLDPNSLYGQHLLADNERTERAYRKFERKARDPRQVSVQDGKTTLTDDAAVLRIAALLDVSQPAKAVPMSKTQREVTV